MSSSLSLLNIANEQLPPVVREAVLVDDDLNLQDISTLIDKVAATQAEERGAADVAGIKLLGKLVDARLKLKYRHDESVMSKCVALLYNTYLTKQLSIPFKSQVLNILTKIIAKKDKSISTFQSVKLDWKRFWMDAVALVARENKIGLLASEQLLSHLVDDILKFLHCARRYICADDAEAMVEGAMSTLSDMRPSSSLEGIILLVTCLPTDFAGYDKWLPVWIQKWGLLDHSPSWDACWLTLLTRARKYSATYPWQQLRPTLFTKARQLLSLKTLNGAAPVEHKFPVFYAKLYSTPYSSRKVALNKVSKLMYFCSFHGSGASAALVAASPIAITPSRPAGTVETAIPGFSADASVSEGTHELALFYQTLRTYFYPSNNGEWSELLGFFVCTMVSEVSRHTARSIAYSVFEETSRSNERFQQPLHLPSLRFLLGTMLSLVLEGLYSRNQLMQRLCSACLKNACMLDPSLAGAIVPFFLSALDDEAVNQPHQATAALYAMTLCVKPLLFPQPALLPYLPALLRLSLPGIDPNNSSKTCITLGMLTAVFSFVPARSSYASPLATGSSRQPPAPYLSLARLEGGPAAAADLVAAVGVADAHYDLLADTLAEWLPSFLDRCFTLLEAQEPKKPGQKPAFMVGSVLTECLGVLFQALDVGDPLRTAAEEKVLSYLLASSPLNAAKIAGRLVEAIVSTNPARLQGVVGAAIDGEVLAGAYSSEKIAFRMRLVSGAVSSAGGEAIVPVLPLLEPLLASGALLHTDKVQRKASVKLLKDVLKGLSSFYPRYQPPVNKQSGLVGGPAEVTRLASLWHEPAAPSLTATAAMLRGTAVTMMGELRVLLGSLGDDGTQGIKRVEETILRKLTVVCKALRGCAEVLADAPSTGGFAGAAEEEDSCPTARGDDAFHTGREEVAQPLALEDRSLLASLRSDVMLFLSFLGDALAGLGAGGGAYGALANSEAVRGAWVKCCRVVQGQRMARLKNVDDVRRYFRTSIRMQTTVLVKTMTKLVIESNASDDISSVVPPAGDWRAELRDLKFWMGHDISSNMMSNRGLVHHVSRLQRYSFSAVRSCLRDARAGPYLLSLASLRALGGHEYERIRNNALKAYTGLMPRFGARLLPDLRSSIAALSSPGAGYCAAAGALTIVSGSGTMRKISASWELTVLFLTSIAGSTAMTAAIPEMDRRESMSNAVAMLFNLYLERWHHSPLSSKDTSAGGEPASVASEALRVAIGDAAGLRQEAHAAFTLLHLLGNPSVPVPPGVWGWAVGAVISKTGPVQVIALCALTKLCYMVHRGALPAPAADVFALCPAMYRQLLQGVSASRPSPSNPQWSKGIDDVILAAAHIKMVLPRAVTHIVGDRVMSSDHLRKENCAIFMCLPDVLAIASAADALSLVQNLIEASRALESTSEEEERAHNSSRAELFAGLYRAFVASPQLLQQQKPYLDSAARTSIETSLVAFLAEAVDKVSNDFNCDWAEAVHFAAIAAPSPPDSKLLAFVVAGAAKALSLTASTNTAAALDEGFLRHEKSLSLARCLLVGDISACAQQGVERSALAHALLDVLHQHGCNTPYRSTRVEVAFIVAALSEDEKGRVSERLGAVVQRLAAEAELVCGDKSAQSASGKSAAETAVYLLQVLVERTAPWRRGMLTSMLLAAALPCCAHADADLAAKAKTVCLLLAQETGPGQRSSVSSAQSANFEEVQRQLLAAARSPSWHVQDVAIEGLVVIMVKNWWLLRAAERTALRDVFSAGLCDAKPEIVESAKSAMVHYLSMKTTRELAAVAAAYTRNSDILAARSAGARRAGAERDSNADKVYVNTMQMCCCLLLSFRYDLPSFLPSLAASVARHMGAAPVQDLVTKTVQEFRASHQDRWDQFKREFKQEELDDLQGAGAAHWYC